MKTVLFVLMMLVGFSAQAAPNKFEIAYKKAVAYQKEACSPYHPKECDTDKTFCADVDPQECMWSRWNVEQAGIDLKAGKFVKRPPVPFMGNTGPALPH